MKLIDTHGHLQFPKLAADVDKVIKRAAEAGVSKIICPGTTLADSQQAIDLAKKFENVWAAAGVHPHDAKDFPSGGGKQLAELLKQPKIVAVGELGLDFFKNYSPKEVQTKVLRQQIEASLDNKLPYIFHVRDAFDDFWSIYDSYPKMPGVIHSFSAGRKELDQCLKRGLYIALNGIMTFTADQEQLEAAKAVPPDKLLLETDGPFLTPKAARGQTCEPKHVRLTAEFLAELRGEKLENLAASTTKNAEELFGI